MGRARAGSLVSIFFFILHLPQYAHAQHAACYKRSDGGECDDAPAMCLMSEMLVMRDSVKTR
jgi:hypothetical protein